MEEIEKKLADEIAKSGNNQLMELWLQYLAEKNKNTESFLEKAEKSNAVKGAIIGAVIGSLFD